MPGSSCLPVPKHEGKCRPGDKQSCCPPPIKNPKSVCCNPNANVSPPRMSVTLPTAPFRKECRLKEKVSGMLLLSCSLFVLCFVCFMLSFQSSSKGRPLSAVYAVEMSLAKGRSLSQEAVALPRCHHHHACHRRRRHRRVVAPLFSKGPK